MARDVSKVGETGRELPESGTEASFPKMWEAGEIGKMPLGTKASQDSPKFKKGFCGKNVATLHNMLLQKRREPIKAGTGIRRIGYRNWKLRSDSLVSPPERKTISLFGSFVNQKKADSRLLTQTSFFLVLKFTLRDGWCTAWLSLHLNYRIFT